MQAVWQVNSSLQDSWLHGKDGCVCACRGQGYLQAAGGETSADMLHSGNGTFRHMGHLLHMPAHIFVRLGRYLSTPDGLLC